MSMFGLGTVLLVAAITGRYGVAGVVAAAGSVGYAGAAPLLARLADRLGQHRVLVPQALAFGTISAAFIGAAVAGAPVWVLLVAGTLAGATMPTLGSMVRARWSALLAGSSRLHTAFSLESVADEVIFVIGPVVVTLLATDIYPAAGVAAATLLCLAGTLLFAGQRRTQPPPGRPAGPAPVTGSRLPARGLLTLGPVYWFLGAMFASIDVTTVAFAAAHGRKPLAGLWLGLYALSSATGGLWYGSRHWRAGLHRRFLLTLCCTVAGVATFWLVPGLGVLAVVMLASGLTISPTLIAGYGLIEQQAPASRRTEGMTWLSSAISVGVAAGSPVAGHLIDTYGPRWGYIFAAACGAAALLTCLAGVAWLRPQQDCECRPEPGPAPSPACG